VERLHEAADQAYDAREAELAGQFGGEQTEGEEGENAPDGAAVMRDIERQITIREIDKSWVHHLADMEYLREGIGLRGYAQVDPLVAYKKEALELFERLQASIQSNVVRDLFTVQVQFQMPAEMDLFEMMRQMGIENLDQLPEGFTVEGEGEDPIAAALARGGMPGPVNAAPPQIPDVGQGALMAAVAASAQQSNPKIPKVGPNDPCPCGSGKKYKNCHRNR
jgi:preprotein translocase subunit SecA